MGEEIPKEEGHRVEIQAQTPLQALRGDRDIREDLESRLNGTKGSGNSLSDDVRANFEPPLMHDFSTVRVHTDNEAARLNQELGAQAFTHGRDIYFGTGQYNPQSDEGRRLLAHELAHVLQQRLHGVNSVDRQETDKAEKGKSDDCVGELGIICPEYLNEDVNDEIAGPGKAYGTCKQEKELGGKKPGGKGFKPLDTLWFNGILGSKCKTDTCKVKVDLSHGESKSETHKFDPKDLLPNHVVGVGDRHYDWHRWWLQSTVKALISNLEGRRDPVRERDSAVRESRQSGDCPYRRTRQGNT